ncbi:e6a3c228-04c5-4af7-b4e7-fc3ec8c31f08 [Thermothielavioides terrestris]|uniref:E6a3c228-04c5-4af7-b4e7-fc3ec8c31f08 n=1 Tax=Thermothielavioides terrestris TaxID=2587410 RepID=A0A446BBB6_9PEZI|nr:e6a3c228-04c5-4af7-b4e7-fc3ec8c31f08 [Thermothielavioides terrestris]
MAVCYANPSRPRARGTACRCLLFPTPLRTVHAISSSESRLTCGQMVGRHAATTETPISHMDQ